MFGFFRKSSPDSALKPEAERVYQTAAARADALVIGCRQALSTGRRPVLVTPFRGHLLPLHALLQARGLPVALLDESYRVAAPVEGALPLLDPTGFDRLAPSLAQGQPVDLFQVERHPLRSYDRAIATTLSTLPAGPRLWVYLSLEDGIFQLFGGNIDRLCRTLDVPLDEPIEHSLVTQAVEKAQRKIADQVPRENPAETFALWRERNLAPA